MTVGYPEVMANIAALPGRKEAGALALCKLYGTMSAVYAKNNARWEDQTSHARQGLWGSAKQSGDMITVFNAHVPHYGIFLELCNQGRFAILEESLNHNLGALKQQLQLMMSIP